jgi:hypothetical protein
MLSWIQLFIQMRIRICNPGRTYGTVLLVFTYIDRYTCCLIVVTSVGTLLLLSQCSDIGRYITLVVSL